MAAFAPVTPLATAKPTIGRNSLTSPLVAPSVKKANVAPTMILRQSIRAPISKEAVYGTYSTIMKKASNYMGMSVKKQYVQIVNPTGVFSVSCTEGSVKHAAEVARTRALNGEYRAKQASPSVATFRMYEERKAAIVNSHNCHHEETQFVDYTGLAATYNLGKSEATGACVRYASPETVEEAAMVRYMDIQIKSTVNPSGVYNIWCNEGAAKGQAEDIRVAALNAAYRQGQKSLLRLLDEKYQQKKAGYIASHGCNYEEGLVSNYPAIGASFRLKSYGY